MASDHIRETRVRDLAVGRWTPTRPALSARAARVRLLALGPPPPGR